MDERESPAPSGEDPRISRRGLLIGAGAAVAVAAVSVAIGVGVTQPAHAPRTPTPTKLAPVPAMLARKPFTVAHRGGSVDWPEMSRFAYDRSVAAGVDGLEMSVVRTSDGVWFGAHDGSLDRISGVTNFTVKNRTWADVKGLRILPPTKHPHQDPQPFLRVEDFIDTYSSAGALWIDPKAVNPRYYAELMSIMLTSVKVPADIFVAKCDAGITQWGELARKNGLQSWGFYYGTGLVADPTAFAKTQHAWSMLGLDWNASALQWQTFEADGRPVVAHVINSRAAGDQARARGAQGLMVSAVSEVLG